MPRPPSAKPRKPKATKIQTPDDQGYEMEDAAPTATAIAEPAQPVMPRAEPSSVDLQPPSTPVELVEETKEETKPAPRGPQKDQIASSINIAKLQAMPMTE